MRLAYYLSLSFLTFLFGGYRGGAVWPLNILALHGVVFARLELRASLYEFVQRSLLCESNFCVYYFGG